MNEARIVKAPPPRVANSKAAESKAVQSNPAASKATEAPLQPASAASIVPLDSIAGRALVAVIAIMAFLASLTLGAVMLVSAAATEWQSAVAREVTIQIRPARNRDIEAEVGKAVAIARVIPGIADVVAYSKDESARLLEPWLGTGLALDDLPVPRLIVIKIASDAAPDLVLLRKNLAERVAGASLDDHRGWIERMNAMARTAVAAGLAILLLVFVATMLSVVFATHGAMATNRPIVEVLHFVGAKDGFIAGEFQRHFLILGLKGGAIGGGAAILLFLLASLFSDWFRATPEQDQIAALFGNLSIGPDGYAALIGQVVLVAAVTAVTSRMTVHRTLKTIE
jgi:cell division transport system permease protein